MLDLKGLEPAVTLADPNEKIEEWYRQRSGKFTCSKFGDLFVTGRGKDQTFGQTAMSYIYQVAAERMGSYSFPASSRSLEWGVENEAAAIEEFKKRFVMEVDYDSHRFFDFDDWTGGSPDALIGECGVVEIKCPYNPAEHLRTLVLKEVPRQYVWQVHGHLLVTGRDYCLFVSFDPRLEGDKRLATVRVDRDEKKIEALKERIVLASREVQRILEVVK